MKSAKSIYRRIMVMGFCFLVLQSANLGQASAQQRNQNWTVAVVAGMNAKNYQLARDWAGSNNEINFVIDVKNLEEMAEKLIAVTGRKKIERLYFIAHGDQDGVIFQNRGKHTIAGAYEFQRLQSKYGKQLGNVFAPNAKLTMISCDVGSNQKLLNAMGNALFSANGGTVQASTIRVRTQITNDKDGAVAEWQETPEDWKRGHRNLSKSPWRSYDVPKGGRVYTPPKKPKNDSQPNQDGSGKGTYNSGGGILNLNSDSFFKGK